MPVPAPPVARLLVFLSAALLPAAPVRGDDYRTPRAGQAAAGTVFGHEVRAPRRDRGRITYLNVGAVLLPGGPDGLELGPSGGAYFWRAPEEGASRLRAIVAGLANEVRHDLAVSENKVVAAVTTFDSLILPWARSEYVQGGRLRNEELEWNQARLGIGVAAHSLIGPAIDNALDVALTLETGNLWFDEGDHTDPAFVLPVKTFEARGHLRARADLLERNIVELPHRGWSAGLDLVWGRRTKWEPWGLPSEGLVTTGQSWLAASAFGVLATGVPGLSERHTLVASAHAGTGSDLDRFSAFRLGSGSTWGDFETLSRVVLPAAGVDEIVTSRYLTVDLEVRYEVFFFLYLQLRGSLAWADVPVRGAAGLETRTGSFPALTAGFTTGLPWNLSMEFAASRSFGLEKTVEGVVEKGRSGFFVSVTREF
ncbi:MAG: hypothetical protein KJ062_09465 [Thermoanaerobaculia bacterium]|nr:hypothetical protein [Thermoanaerobaculia bacterium]